ncbi:MAG: flagellar hook-basal body complex protein FliE, partial [Syntrophomonadaceae bacterium]|nr:flagellar hook-basal body complex protein FliE [Syntrophomonadaceae bacterium]
MKVDRIALQALQPLQSPFAPAAPQPGAGSSFADILSNALGQVEQLQQQAASSAYDLAVGNQSDVHTT